MTADRGEQGWAAWDSIVALTATAASASAVVGYVSVGAAVVIGRSAGELWRATWRALDRVAANTEQTNALAVGMQKARKRRKPRAELSTQAPGSPREAPSLQAAAGEAQWIIWSDAESEAQWAGVTFNLDWPAGK